MIRPLLCFAGLAAALVPASSRAQPMPKPLPPKVMEFRPAAAPVPALKYRLFPERRDLIAGNAAVFYHRANQMVIETRYRRLLQAQAEKSPTARTTSVDESINDWVSGAIQDIPREEARKQLEVYRNALREVELGARREDCNWEFDHRDEGFALLLPDIQETRTLARLVSLQARLEILDGHPEAAIKWLRTGFVLGRHVAKGTSVIQSLIGLSITQVMAGVLEELIQAPGAPNLYWALANLPRPLIDLSYGFEGERFTLEREIPGLKDLGSEAWSLDRARTFVDRFLPELALFNGIWAGCRVDTPSTPPPLNEWNKRLILAALVARAYPDAKLALIARGRPAAQVEAMPAIQVVALHSMTVYEQIRDEVAKWGNIPYYQAYKGYMEVDHVVGASFGGAHRGIPFEEVLPMTRGVRLASVRGERRLAAIQCIEAIRLYAEGHAGALPESLDAMTGAPALVDPATGKPFDYKANGSSASLSGPIVPGETYPPYNTIAYELKVTR